MDETTDILGLPLLIAGQAQKHITHNEALLALDAVVQLVVKDRSRTAPPSVSDAGDRHLVAFGASGAWAGQEGRIALRIDGAWQFIAPQPGWRAFVLAEMQDAVYDGSAWQGAEARAFRAPTLGVNAESDTTNRLTVASGAVLFNHAGDDMRLKINKSSASQTACLLYQSGFSGRAEMGLMGADDFAIKTSADGSSWRTGLTVGALDGAVDAPQGLSVAGAPVYARSNVLGTVDLAAGVPTGALIETGATAQGRFARWADGTQICWHEGLSLDDVATPLGAGYGSGLVTWTYPRAFATGSLPVVTGLARKNGVWLSLGGADAVAATFTGLSFVAEASAVAVGVQAVGRWST